MSRLLGSGDAGPGQGKPEDLPCQACPANACGFIIILHARSPESGRSVAESWLAADRCGQENVPIEMSTGAFVNRSIYRSSPGGWQRDRDAERASGNEMGTRGGGRRNPWIPTGMVTAQPPGERFVSRCGRVWQGCRV